MISYCIKDSPIPHTAFGLVILFDTEKKLVYYSYKTYSPQFILS